MTVPEAEELLRREIDADESLLWAGVPRSGLIFRASDLFSIPFTIIWFTIFRETMWPDWKHEGPPPLILIVVLFIGSYVLVGRFLVEAYARSRTAYGVTSRRVLIIRGLVSKSVTSLGLDMLPEITMTEKRDKSGTITFGQVPSSLRVTRTGQLGWRFSLGPRDRAPAPPSFYRVSEVSTVLDVIRQAQKSFKK